MALINLKYQLNYGHLNGDVFRCDIFKIGAYDGDVIQLDGYCVHSYKKVSDILEPIRGASLDVNFLANAEQILEDLEVIQEFQFFIAFFRNDENIFAGWVLPDGIFQDYVNDRWNVVLKAVDGLGFLKNYEYIPQTNVTIGASTVTVTDVYPQEFNILYTILQRIGYGLPIATMDDINQGFDIVTGEPYGSISFANINNRIVNKEVFINKNENYFDCERILKDILQKYNFIIFQGFVGIELCWIVSRPAFQLSAGKSKGSVWKPISVTDNKITFTRASTFEQKYTVICSDAQSGEVPHDAIHCNQNQNITYKPAVQNFRFDQKWLGLKNQYYPELTDEYFDKVLFTDPLDEFVLSGIQVNSASPGGGADVVFRQDEFINLPADYQDLTFKFELTLNGAVSGSVPSVFNLEIQGSIEGSALAHYVVFNADSQLVWKPITATSGVLALSTQLSGTLVNRQVLYEVKVPFIAGLYRFKVNILRPFNSGVEVVNKIGAFWSKIFLGIGEYHDAKLLNFKSSYLNPPVVVINSNQNDDVFLNNLYRNSSGTLIPEGSWNRGDIAPVYDDLLELTSRERLDILQRPQMIFSGDVYGYFPYFTVVTYDRISGQFLPLQYSYNTLQNIIRLESSQAFSNVVNKTYDQKYYFEDEKNVLIKEL